MASMIAGTNGTGKQYRASARGGWAVAALFAVVACGATVISGCAGLATTSNASSTPQDAVQISPSDITFANVAAGQKVTQTATLTNTGEDSVTITQVALSSTQFAVSGVKTPLTIRPGQSTNFQVTYTGATSGSSSGTLSAMTSKGGSSSKARLKGLGAKAASTLSLSTTALNFGKVLVNGSSTQAVTLKNSGTTDIQITQVGISGGGYTVSGVATPAILPAGQSMALQATFAPKTEGASAGAITVTSDAQSTSSTVALSGTAVTGSYSMSFSPGSVNLGNVNVGSSATQNLQLSNTGNSNVTLTQVAASGAGVSISGIVTPVTIAPTQGVTLTVKYSPTTSGPMTGSVTVVNDQGVNAVAAVAGTGVQPGINLTPSTVSLGSVVTGSTNSRAVQITNSGTASLTISQATVAGTGFSLSGLALPQTLAPGQTGSFNVQYAPKTAGAVSGSISIVSNAPNSPSTVALSGTGVAGSYTMSLSPATVSFGSVNVGSSTTQNVQLSNTGNSSVTVTQIGSSGSGISVSGVATPVTIVPSQSVMLTVKYSPATSGATSGSVTVVNDQGVNAVATVTGTGVESGITLTPTTASFGSVVTGNTNSQTIQIKNSGTASLTISQATVTGTGFSIGGLTLPLALAPGQTGSFNVQYAPKTAGAVSGSISIVSDAPNSPATVALSGTGVAATYAISLSPSSLGFGSVTNGSTTAQSFIVTNTGNSNVAISGMSVTGTGYSIVSGGGAVTLSPNQSNSVSVQFAPTTAGTANGSVSIVSNASGSATSVSLSGTGVAPVVPHSVDLNWGASTSSVTGYNVYRSSVSGSAYAKVNASVVAGVSYADSSVQSGQTYYYVATAVDASGNESVYSNEVSVVIP